MCEEGVGGKLGEFCGGQASLDELPEGFTLPDGAKIAADLLEVWACDDAEGGSAVVMAPLMARGWSLGWSLNSFLCSITHVDAPPC